jgi:hypothetical protein
LEFIINSISYNQRIRARRILLLFQGINFIKAFGVISFFYYFGGGVFLSYLGLIVYFKFKN